MKKTKIEQHLENAFNAFFEDETLTENTSLALANNASLLQNDAPQVFVEKADEYFNLFKKAFLFLPGILILHLACFAAVEFYKDVGINFWMLFWFASGIFMVWAGFGDLKNKRHSLIPLSVISVGLLAAVISGLLPPSSLEDSLYFFPLFFITPVLVKKLIDKCEEAD